MKVLLLTKYPRMGASSRLRTLQYLPYLEQQGFEFTVQSLFDEAYLKDLYSKGSRSRLAILSYYFKRLLTLCTVFRYDLVWIEYELFPYLPSVFERFLALIGKRYVVDYDDAIFHNYDLSPKPVIRRFLGKKIDVVMRRSACVVAGNTYLAERAHKAGAEVVKVIPTVVDSSRYIPKEDVVSQRLVIGWIGSPSTQKYVVGIYDALLEVCHKYNARLMLVGASADIALELEGLDVQVLPWSEASESELIRKMDIGIMPLPDGPWEKGKCGYKLIQYMACAVPVIGSSVGVNVDIIEGSKCGLLADTSDEWIIALEVLLSSHKERKKLGNAGREAVETKYSLQVQAPILAHTFHEIIKSDIT
ncbi:glycosyltransferase family 4 protein [Denitrificimonas sp. JX-1]|uniref:Glycosyltransferase family 4 protein n=1 Tax=Denitrificimonas halotolerans TaxID=3098930 RepID=A0ABU5GR01_9GAMM|nr:glycosyltransferase family 4 protein [Denitrificimonas sp. JX-1]MDY7219411.1 glycosyltransferase family 4 protein [Denitrificimonas sp. JX-1]